MLLDRTGYMENAFNIFNCSASKYAEKKATTPFKIHVKQSNSNLIANYFNLEFEFTHAVHNAKQQINKFVYTKNGSQRKLR